MPSESSKTPKRTVSKSTGKGSAKRAVVKPKIAEKKDKKPEVSIDRNAAVQMVERKRKEGVFRDRYREGEEVSSIDGKKVCSGLKRHFVLFALSIAFFACGGWGIAQLLSHSFEAESFLLYEEEQPFENSDFQVTRHSLDTVLEMLLLPVHFQEVKARLNLKESVDILSDRTWIDLVGEKSNLIRITCQWGSPQVAADLANTLSKVVVEHNEELHRTQLQKAHQYFLGRSNELQKKLEEDSRALVAFESSHPKFELSSGNSRLIDEVTELEMRFQDAALKCHAYFLESENLKKELTHIPNPLSNVVERNHDLQSRIKSTERALLQARNFYSSDDSRVRLLESSLRELKKMEGEKRSEWGLAITQGRERLKEKLELEQIQLQGKLRASTRLKNELEGLLAEKKRDLASLPEEQRHYVQLYQKRIASESEWKSVQKMLHSLEIQMALGKGELDFYQIAENPKRKASQWTRCVPFFPLFGVLVGAIVGLFFAAIVEVVDRRLVTAKQIELLYNIPCLQVVPEITTVKNCNFEQELLFYIRELYERLLVSGSSKSMKTLAMTSATEGEGKSILAYNLALYMGKRLDQRVLLITFDSDDQFSKSYPIESPQAYLEDWLRGGVTMRDIVSSGEVDVIRGTNEEETKELLQTKAFQQLWESCLKAYDRIIIDVPGVIDDVLYSTLMRLSEQALYVVGSAKTKRSIVNSCLEAMDAVGVIPCGIILNGVPCAYLSDARVRAERKRRAKSRARQRATK